MNINLEKSILDHVSGYIQNRRIAVTQEEQKCLNTYEKTPYIYGLLNMMVWGYIAYKTLDFSAVQTVATPMDSSQIIYESIHGKNAPSPLTIPKPPTTRPPKSTLVRPKVVRPAWLNVLGVLAISAGAFATTWFSSKLAARDCLQCFLDTKDKTTALNTAVRQVLKQHHPNADKFFDREKYRLDRIKSEPR